MKIKSLFIFLLAIALILFSSAVLGGKGSRGSRDGGGIDSLTDTESQDIIFMREEEKLARDVYITLGDLWGTLVFANIAKSEQRHMDAMEVLIEKYGLNDPVVDEGPAGIGVFTNGYLHDAYWNILLPWGQTSELEALKVGAYIEELDMRDIVEAIERTNKIDIIEKYEELLRGSRNHLRAFVEQLEKQGFEYESVILVPQGIWTQEHFDEVVDSDKETGPGH